MMGLAMLSEAPHMPKGRGELYEMLVLVSDVGKAFIRIFIIWYSYGYYFSSQIIEVIEIPGDTDRCQTEGFFNTLPAERWTITNTYGLSGKH